MINVVELLSKLRKRSDDDLDKDSYREWGGWNFIGN